MATNSRHRKNHKEKVAARKKRLVEEKARMNKLQREFIMNLIKQEQEKGLFENSKPVDTNGPIIDGPVIDGPIIDAPVLDITENTQVDTLVGDSSENESENNEVENVTTEESSESETN